MSDKPNLLIDSRYPSRAQIPTHPVRPIPNALEALGSLGDRNCLDKTPAQLRLKGLGRATVLTILTGTTIFSLYKVVEHSEASGKRFTEKVAACASHITGKEVELADDGLSGLTSVATNAANQEVVEACEVARGDTEQATARLDR